MLQVLWELLRQGNRPVPVPASHCLERAQARQQLAAHQAVESLTWLGHACFLIRVAGLSILTDPFLSERASPFRFSGPRRLVPTPLRLEDLPPVDLILMSHNHYDHLDAPTLRLLARRQPRIRVIAPLGLTPLLASLGLENVQELDWYQQAEMGAVRVVALPGYHFSGRTLWDENQTLWAGFGIHTPGRRLFFAGDTGYGPEFQQIGARTGPYDVGLVPIGAYGPREVFAAVHASPEEAVKMGEDVGAAHLVGMHWGTIRLTTEPFLEPAERFLAAPSTVPRSLMAIGETRDLQTLS